MIKTKTVLEIQKGDKVYQLLCDPDAPLGELHDVLHAMKAHVVGLISGISVTPASEKSDVAEQQPA